MTSVPGREIAKYLNQEFARRAERNPRYSLRAFARDMDMSVGAASEILNGIRPVSNRLARAVVPFLALEKKTQEHLLSLLDADERSAPAVYELIETSNEQCAKVIAEGLHFAILSLTETQDFKNDPAWIAARLDSSEEQVTAALHRLKSLGYLVERDGRMTTSSPCFTSTSRVPSSALKAAQYENLDRARRAIESEPIERYDTTAITMAIDPDKIPLAIELIAEFRDNLSRFLESGQRREVFKFSMQLIPWSRSAGEVDP